MFRLQKGGNVFQFLEQIESISFIEAVKILGERAGIEVKTDDDTPKPDNEQSKMIAMHEAMAHYYNYVLKAIEQAEPALKYLYSEGSQMNRLHVRKSAIVPTCQHLPVII